VLRESSDHSAKQRPASVVTAGFTDSESS
jgi:hypothetical protein